MAVIPSGNSLPLVKILNRVEPSIVHLGTPKKLEVDMDTRLSFLTECGQM